MRRGCRDRAVSICDIERGGLIVTLGLHQDAGVLQLGIGLEGRAVVGKRQRQRLGEHALGIGVARPWA